MQGWNCNYLLARLKVLSRLVVIWIHILKKRRLHLCPHFHLVLLGFICLDLCLKETLNVLGIATTDHLNVAAGATHIIFVKVILPVLTAHRLAKSFATMCVYSERVILISILCVFSRRVGQ